MKLSELAYARSGDKGNNSNIGIIANDEAAYELLRTALTSSKVAQFFKKLGVTEVKRYELPNLLAFNFILINALDGGGSRSLRTDAQGKALGQALLQMELEDA